MAASSASIAASKLLNLRNPALQNLVRRHLIQPSAAATSSAFRVAESSNLFRLENGGIHFPDVFSDGRGLNLQAYNFVLDLQPPSATRIEAARTYVPSAPKDDAYEDLDDDDDDSDDDDYSGSDFDDEIGDEDEEPDTRTRSRRG